jgi:hypothetical protein
MTSSPSRRSDAAAAFVPDTTLPSPLAITLRHADHTYWFGEERVIGATESLLELGLFDPSYYTADGRDRGGRVHERTAAADRGDPTPPPVLAEELGYVRSWHRYCDVWRPEMLLVERALWDPRRRVAGCPDRVAILRRPGVPVHLAILDPKTGAEEPWHRYQLAIYDVIVAAWLELCPVPRTLAALPRRRYAIYLREDGGAPKVRAHVVEPVAHAIVAAAQLKRALAPRGR